MKAISSVRSVMKEPAATSAKLAEALAAARAHEVEARAEAIRLTEARPALLADDVGLEKNRAAIRACAERVEDCALFAAELEKRLAAAQRDEDQARRRQAYASAEAKAGAAARKLAADYPRICGELLDLLKVVAEAQVDVIAANRLLPDDANPIGDPEHSARGVPMLEQQIVSSKIADRWVRIDSDRPVDDQAAVSPTGNGFGRCKNDTPGGAYRMAKFRRTTFRSAVHHGLPLPLAAALRLPAVRGPGCLIGEFGAYSNDYNSIMYGFVNSPEAMPAATLGRLAAIETPCATPKLVRDDRPVEVRWELLGYLSGGPSGINENTPYSADWEQKDAAQ